VILEGIVTTVSPEGVLNVAPMGPMVDDDAPAWPTQLVFRPFATSTTHANLLATGVGVFHVTDDALLLARSAVEEISPPTLDAVAITGRRLADCCRFFEFRIVEQDTSKDRPWLVGRVIHAGRIREFFGFNRAKHAVLEAAILATRIHLMERASLMAELDRLAIVVEKTAGHAEREAYQRLVEFIHLRVGVGG
jgi:hypothetical protein